MKRVVLVLWVLLMLGCGNTDPEPQGRNLDEAAKTPEPQGLDLDELAKTNDFVAYMVHGDEAKKRIHVRDVKTRGPITKEQVDFAFAARGARLLRCYDEDTERSKGEAALPMTVRIDTSGNVREVSVASGESLGNLGKCVEKIIREWKFAGELAGKEKAFSCTIVISGAKQERATVQ